MFGILYIVWEYNVALCETFCALVIDGVFSPCRRERFTPSRHSAAQVKVWSTMTWSALTT